MIITNSTFDAKHDLDYKTPLYLVIFENEAGGYSNHMVAGVSGIDSLNFDAQTGSFTPTNTITGASSGATATILSVTDDGTTGILYLTSVVGTFQDNEIIYESALGSELITTQNDRDFSSETIGNWILSTNGTGTLLYDGANPGAEKVGKLTSAGDEAWLSAALQGQHIDATSEGAHKLQLNAYVPAGNTKKELKLIFYSGSGHTLLTQTLSGDTWTELTGYFYANADLGSADSVQLSIYSATAGDIVYYDDVSVKQITNAALANGTVYKTYTHTGTELLDKEDDDLLVLEDGSGGGFLIQPGGSLAYKRYLRGIAGLQQRVTPEEGKGTIGGITFELLDVDNEITALLATDPYFFHRRKTTIKAGYAGMNEDDLLNIMVGWVTGIKLSNDGLMYSFTVTDPQKWMQRKIFRGSEDTPVTISGNALNILLAVLTSTGDGTNGTYDWFAEENGLGISIDYINIAGIESVRDDWYPGASVYMTFTITERIKAKDFIENEILKPLNLYPVVDGHGRFSVKPFKPPLAITDEVVVIDEDVIVPKLPSWDMNLAAVVNEVEWHYNYSDDDYGNIDFYIDSDSLNNRGPGKKSIVIKSKGFSAFDSLMTRSKNRIFGRFAAPPIKINATCWFSRWLVEAGDIVSFSHSKLPDIEAGTRGIDSRLMEVISRTIDWRRGQVKIELLDTGFTKGIYNAISPTMTITGVTDQEHFAVSTEDAAKYVEFTLPEVQICDAGMRQKVESVTILSVDADTGDIVIDSAGVDLSAGWIVMFAEYDDVTSAQKNFGYIADSADTLGTANDDAHLIVP